MQQDIFYRGNGKFSFPNGDTYEGDYCAHRHGIIWREGLGTYVTHDGQIYSGNWKDDKLIENLDVNVKYEDGAEFNGKLYKNKYKGVGVYKFENDLRLSCDFTDNKPTGELILFDNTNHIWMGKTDNDHKNNNNDDRDRAILYHENVFYTALCQDKGIGKIKEKPIYTKLKRTPKTLRRKKRAQLTVEQIFAKSTKTINDIDFTRSQWYQNYNKFKLTKANIETKIRDVSEDGLDDDEKEWWTKYILYKNERTKNKRKSNESLKDDNETIDINLLNEFNSERFKNNCPPIRVFYPRIDWDEFYDPNETTRRLSIDNFDKKTSIDTFKRIFKYYESAGKYDVCLSTADLIK